NMNCTGDYKEYSSVTVCQKMCEQFDSVDCRFGHAVMAATDPKESQLGGPVAAGCSETTPCHEFCSLDQSLCGSLFPYDGGTTCQTYPYYLANAADAGDGGPGDLGTLQGDNLNCRIYHLEAAIAGMAGNLATHCPHTSQTNSQCGN